MMRTTRIRSIYRIPNGANPAVEAHQIAARELATEAAPELVENASLLLSEIMAERARISAHVSPRLTVDVRRSGSRHRWSVIDRGTPALPAGLRSTALDRMADAWGVSRRSGMTRTWFELLHLRNHSS